MFRWPFTRARNLKTGCTLVLARICRLNLLQPYQVAFWLSSAIDYYTSKNYGSITWHSVEATLAAASNLHAVEVAEFSWRKLVALSTLLVTNRIHVQHIFVLDY